MNHQLKEDGHQYVPYPHHLHPHQHQARLEVGHRVEMRHHLRHRRHVSLNEENLDWFIENG